MSILNTSMSTIYSFGQKLLNMRTVVFSLGFAGLLGFALHQPSVEATDPKIKNKSGILLNGERPFTGILIERNLNHDLLAKSHYKDGQKEGYSYSYHHDGAMVSKVHFHHGKKDGRQDLWYVDGRHRSVSYFKNGIAEGLLTEWHPNGRIYIQQKIENGVELEKKMFYETGVIYSNYVVHENRTYGIQGEPLCQTVKQEGFK